MMAKVRGVCRKMTRPNVKRHGFRNLSRRPRAPAENCGRVQRQARRALLVLGKASTTEISESTHRRPSAVLTRSTRRVLERMAVRIGRADAIGRPWIWRFQETLSSDEP